MLSQTEVEGIVIDCQIKVRYKGIDIFRELAKRPEIKLSWSVSKGCGQPLFPGPVCEWNFLQKKLVYWLQFYESVENSYDRPPSRVIQNDKMLDEWVSEKSKEADNQFEINWSKGSSKISKSAYDHDEVYELDNFRGYLEEGTDKD
jgi:hypothetical protein